MTLASPYALLVLLVIPAGVAVAVLLKRRRARYPVSFTNLELLAGVVEERRRSARRYAPGALLLLALVAASAAVAQPRIKMSQPQRDATVVLLADVSGSMNAHDVEPSRLDAAEAAMRIFVARLPRQARVGLVAFSTEADPLVAPTTDRNTLNESISLLEPEAGTALGAGINAAVGMARSSLRSAGFVRTAHQPVPAAIVLLSDGKQTSPGVQPLTAARRARAAGIRIYPVSLGTPRGTVTSGFGAFTNTISVPPDPQTMQTIAAISGGKAYTAPTASDAINIYRNLGSAIARISKPVAIASWFAGAAALLLSLAVLTGQLGTSRIP